MSLKICFLSLLHRYDDTRVFYKEARSLAAAGFEVTHLASGKVQSFIKDGVRIEIYHSYDKKGIRGRVGKFLPLYKRAVELDADCYHCNEFESWLVGLLIKLFHPKKKIIFDVHEYYPSRFEHPIFPRWLDKVAAPVTKFLYRKFAPKTDHVIVVNPAFADDFPISKDKITTVYNYGLLEADLQDRHQVPSEVKHKFPDSPTAIHIGGFDQSRGWPQLIEALGMMKCKDFAVMCLGDLGPDKERILSKAEHLGIGDRVRVEPRVPFEEMFNYLLCASAGLILFQPGLKNHVMSFPQKLLDYMLASLPVVGPNFAVEIDKLVRLEECGLTIDTSNPVEIAEALDWLSENFDLAKEMGRNGRNAIFEKYNWECEAKKLVKVYEHFKIELSK
jgi:glycosyltransferase involved in cell wall biosynthesis